MLLLIAAPLVLFVLLAGSACLYLIVAKGARARDFRLLYRGIKGRMWVTYLRRMTKLYLIDEMWDAQVKKSGVDEVAFVHAETGVSYTYGAIEAISNRFAHVAVDLGMQPGDVVAVYLQSAPFMVAAWLGFAKRGVQVALLNNNAKGAPLEHAVQVSGARVVVCDATYAERFAAVSLPSTRIFRVVELAPDGSAAAGAHDGVGDDLNVLLAHASERALPCEQRALQNGVSFTDPALFVYTSGTTGLPKAAKITHARFIGVASLFITMCGVRSDDCLYTALPLYHSAGGMIGVGLAIVGGCRMVVRSKFSASAFARDVCAYECTIMQYVGELCRYLAAHPPTELDKRTRLRAAIGNGLRPDVWPLFQRKYGNLHVYEFYGATEGAGALMNIENREGAIGYLSETLRVVQRAALVRYDVERDEVVRDEHGHCVPCDVGEPGEFVVEVRVQAGTTNFDGYTDEAATKKKLMRDVFVDGDVWFRSGDLLRRDAEDYVFWVDRIGDTFRWKGENCSTAEVGAVVSRCDGVAEANVYGVRVGSLDGRAGMAAISVRGGDIDLHELARVVTAELPAYSIPIFVRVLPSSMQQTITSTFKYKKGLLREQGCDPAKVQDPLYVYLDGEYRPLTKQLYEEIASGKRRV